MKRMFVWLIAASLSIAPLIRAQDPDPNKQVDEQLKEAAKAAKRMGVQMPDVKKLLDENAKEEASEQAKAQERTKNVATKPVGPIALPAWAPKVPQFTSASPAAIKTIDGKEKIVVTGTSPLSPEALADAWDKFKNEKFSHERTGSNINGSVTQIVTYSRAENPIEEVRMEAERKAGAKVTRVTLSSPLVEVQEPLEESAAKSGDGKKDAADGAQPTASAPSATAVPAQPSVNIPAGVAKGSLTYDGASAELKFASAFVDQKDARKPVVVLITDQKLPTEKWKSEFDMMMDHTKWSGLVFFLDKEGTIYRTDVHTNGQASVSGIFDVKIDNPTSKDLTGTAKTKVDEKETKLDVTFHATLK